VANSLKLLVDMNLSPRWVAWFEVAGVQSEHWSRLGAPTASDSELMAYAVEHGYTVLTHDLDFSAILAVTRASLPSVIQIRSDTLAPDDIGPSIVAALRQLERELVAGALVTVDPSRTRARVLPLRDP
jgi:predicted nuclease of predicted toxin-antitoxin system